VIVRFVDIGGIVDDHCLNFLFIICLNNDNIHLVYAQCKSLHSYPNSLLI